MRTSVPGQEEPLGGTRAGMTALLHSHWRLAVKSTEGAGLRKVLHGGRWLPAGRRVTCSAARWPEGHLQRRRPASLGPKTVCGDLGFLSPRPRPQELLTDVYRWLSLISESWLRQGAPPAAPNVSGANTLGRQGTPCPGATF
uniref:Uncharacterized protein n=1 Tax=Rousettus aegyptiacus TaxID=9407 RepID=A0A7J8DX51_ROUAE|nr:hypothetical protein HJG63_008277 [Rousettus aegyptiacus]